MKAHAVLIALALTIFVQGAIAQGAGGPPPQTFEDCRGKKVGEVVQHTAPGGRILAMCESSPDGLIARPARPHPIPPPAS